MKFLEVMEACNNEALIYDDFSSRASVYYEAVTNDYKQTLRDLDILALEKSTDTSKEKEEADKKYLDRMNKAFKAQGQKFKEFVNNTSDKIKSIGKKEEEKPESLLKRIIDQTKKDKNLANKKVDIKDIKGLTGVREKWQDKIKREQAKVKSNKKATAEDFKKLAEIERDANADINKNVVIASAIGIAAAATATILIIKSIDKTTTDAATVAKMVDNVDLSTAEPEVAEYMARSTNLAENLDKNILSKMTGALYDNMAKIKHVLKGEGTVSPDLLKESAENDVPEVMDTDKYIETLEQEMFGVKDFDPNTYLTEMVNEMDESADDLIADLLIDELKNESSEEVNDEDETFESVDDLLASIENELFND